MFNCAQKYTLSEALFTKNFNIPDANVIDFFMHT